MRHPKTVIYSATAWTVTCLLLAAGCSVSPTEGTPTVELSGAWGDGLTLEQLPDTSNTKVGERLGPTSLTVTTDGIVVLDPVAGRLVLVDLDTGSLETLESNPAYRAGIDIAVDHGGTTWVLGPPSCSCVRRVDPILGVVDVPIAPSLLPGRLVSTNQALALESGGRLHVLIEGVVHTLDEQLDTTLPGPWHSDLGVALSRTIYNGVLTLTAINDDFSTAFTHELDFGGRVSRVEVLTPSCNGSILLVALVLGQDGLLYRMQRLDRKGRLLANASAPLADDFDRGTTPFRSFVAGPDGELYELRTGGGGYAILSWPTGC